VTVVSSCLADCFPALLVAWPDSRKYNRRRETNNSRTTDQSATVCSSLKRFHFSAPFRDYRLINLLDDRNETVIITNISYMLTYNGATTLQRLIQCISPKSYRMPLVTLQPFRVGNVEDYNRKPIIWADEGRGRTIN